MSSVHALKESLLLITRGIATALALVGPTLPCGAFASENTHSSLEEMLAKDGLQVPPTLSSRWVPGSVWVIGDSLRPVYASNCMTAEPRRSTAIGQVSTTTTRTAAGLPSPPVMGGATIQRTIATVDPEDFAFDRGAEQSGLKVDCEQAIRQEESRVGSLDEMFVIIATRQGQVRVTSCTKIEGKALTVLGRADGEWGKYCELESESVLTFGYRTVPLTTFVAPTLMPPINVEVGITEKEGLNTPRDVPTKKEEQPETKPQYVGRVNRSAIAGFSVVAGVGGGVLVALGADQEAHIKVGASRMSEKAYNEARTQTNRTYLAGYVSIGVSALGITWALAW